MNSTDMMPITLSQTEETYRRVSGDFPVIPFPHYLASVWEGMKRLYPKMTPEFWAAQERRVGIHWNMGLTVERSIDELRPFADAQINARRYDPAREFKAVRKLCKQLTEESR